MNDDVSGLFLFILCKSIVIFCISYYIKGMLMYAKSLSIIFELIKLN